MRDVIVIGSGVSGLSFAHYCGEAGLDTLVLEKAASIGGCVQSWRQPDGFWTELGAHTCYNSYGAIIAILEKRGALGKLLPRDKDARFRLLVGGEVVPFYRPLHWGELLLHAPRLLFARKDGKTVRQFYEPLVGPRNYREVLGPMFTAVPSQPADDLPAEMMFKTRARRKDVLRSFTLEGGLSTLIDVMAATPHVEVRTGADVVALERTASGVRVKLASGTTEEARSVALALPPDAAARLAEPLSAAAAKALGQVGVTPIDTLGVVVPKEATAVGKAAGIIPLDGRFYSVVTRDTVPDERWRGFAFHARPGQTLVERLAQAESLLGIKAEKLDPVARREIVLPSPRLGHTAIVHALEAAIAGLPLYVTGNYFGGLSLEDCVLRSRGEVSRLQAGK
jgi:oxygen-dependent protoporphyrinogen oxidase